ncbi:unnamed protein product [Ceratitis capitata]|uniref:(Mediterranean fruit fly) hypothetical protein n=1 Tax=Ceratitis capitata TaxID=7213 RepID=A0A811VGZ6_CERCA|nr:unnamed protein product [Ceratitis capitata]
MFSKFKDIAQYLCLALLLCTFATTNAQYQHYVDTLGANVFFEHPEGSQSPIHYLNEGDSEFVALDLDRPMSFYSEKYDKLFLAFLFGRRNSGVNCLQSTTDAAINHVSIARIPSSSELFRQSFTSQTNTEDVEKLLRTECAPTPTLLAEFVATRESTHKWYSDIQHRVPEYINQPFPLEYPSIAPFYANVDTTLAYNITSISVFESSDEQQLQRATDLVKYAYPDKSDFVADKLIVATWKNVGHFSAKNDKLNTFQAVLIANEEQTFVQFIYEHDGIQWLQGETGALGLPDIRAQAGFVAEDGRHYYIEGSGTDSARFTFSENSNIGVPGVWLFHVGALNETANVEVPIDQETSMLCHKPPLALRADTKLATSIRIAMISQMYTAVNPVSAELGAQLRLIVPVFSAIGWLFAKPLKGALNGYHLTGGDFVHSSRIRFDTGESLLVNQTFEGLNYWDQLSVKLELFGDVPFVNGNANYIWPIMWMSTRTCPPMRSVYRQECATESFEDCFRLLERDQALRTSVLTKIGVDAESNACTDGTAICGENTVCVPYEDTYRCDCRHGFAPQLQADNLEVCVDIDECLLQTHACDENALCTNTMVVSPLSHDADCVEGRCQCRAGSRATVMSVIMCVVMIKFWKMAAVFPFCWMSIKCNLSVISWATARAGWFELVEESQVCRLYRAIQHDYKSDELVPCDVDANCHINATCEWYENEMRHACTCNHGFQGDGYNCELIDTSCTYNADVCDPTPSVNTTNHVAYARKATKATAITVSWRPIVGIMLRADRMLSAMRESVNAWLVSNAMCRIFACRRDVAVLSFVVQMQSASGTPYRVYNIVIALRDMRVMLWRVAAAYRRMQCA